MKQRASIFHATVAKLLFIAKRARPDILLAISFLTTRVKEPDEDDWGKLKRVLGYLSGTPDIYLTLSCEDLDKLIWYVDGSSTETELIAIDDLLPMIQWTKNFLKEQGYYLDTVIHEDNRSTMLLMKNGRLSSGKRTTWT
jgi:hypothetical protein